MILRRLSAVLLGLVVVVAMVQLAEVGAHQIYPPPPGLSMKDMNAIKAYVASMPMPPMLLVLAGRLVGTFLGTWAAVKVGRSPIPAYVVVALLFCGGIASAIIIPQPIWFSIALFVSYIAAAIIAARLAAPPPTAAPAQPPA